MPIFCCGYGVNADADTNVERPSFFENVRDFFDNLFGPKPRLGAPVNTRNFRPPVRRIKFLVDSSLAPFYDTITLAHYHASRVDSPRPSQLEILKRASKASETLLTTDPEYLSIATKQNNRCGILILPDYFNQPDRFAQNSEELRDLLTDYSDIVHNVKLYPAGVNVATMVGNRWTVVKEDE